MRFTTEKVADVEDAILELAPRHNAAAGWAPRLNVAVGNYLALERVGALRVYVAWTPEGAVAGYGVFVISPHMHYGVRVATQDSLYVLPAWRPHALEFMAWQDRQLEAEGVEAIFRCSTRRHPYGPALERLGYSQDSVIYVRRPAL